MATIPPSLVSDLYARALARPSAERRAFVRAATGGDEPLRAEVEALLAHHAEHPPLTEPPDADPGAGSPVPADLSGHGLGPYAILGPLGRGGMGIVYRARDTRLGRDVAIKLLPPELTADAGRRDRFAHEARVLATLNHPHIGAIYGVEEIGDARALVLELVEGPTLAARLGRGPLPLGLALTVAAQIADALDAAHQLQIVHRDLKPANIVLRGLASKSRSSSDPQVKVLDFGLAKSPIVVSERPGSGHTGSVTRDGLVAGSPAYMSPEQACGEPVDKRTDIWAFGCVLYEMLTGRRAFDASTPSATLARVIEREPDWSALPEGVPPRVRRLLEHCLRKDRDRRLRDIGDVAAVLGDDTPETERAAAAGRRFGGALIAIAGGLGGALLAFMAGQYVEGGGNRSSDVQPFTYDVALPPSWEPNSRFEVSPDGRRVVTSASALGETRLWVLQVGQPAWTPLEGTAGASAPFWSPDGQSVGFFTGDRLQTLALGDITPRTVATIGTMHVGASWGTRDSIVFGGSHPVYAVPAGGGTPVAVTTLDGEETGHRWPSFLPDGDHFVFLAQGQNVNDLRIGSVTSRTVTSLGVADSHAVFAGGRLFFVNNGRLMSQALDLDSLTFRGAPALVAAGVGGNIYSRGDFAVSPDVLAVTTGGPMLSELTWFDRRGTVVGTVGDPGIYFNLTLNPAGTRLAVASARRYPNEPWNTDIWLYDLDSGRSTRLTTHPAPEFDPAWSSDDVIAFNSGRPSTLAFSLWLRDLKSRAGEALVWKPSTTWPEWAPGGEILVTTTGPEGQGLYAIDPARGEAARPFIATTFHETGGVFSPDGKWVAYHSEESGRLEVYVRAYPSGLGPHKVSRDGGRAAHWRGDGRELFFLDPGSTMMAAAVDPRTGASDIPRPLFATGLGNYPNGRPYVVTRDGQRFLLPVRRTSTWTPNLRLTLHWARRPQ